MSQQSAQLFKAIEIWKRLNECKRSESYELDGHSLQVADVLATAYFHCTAKLSSNPQILTALQSSTDVLFDHLANDWYIYGVNTGFGGSADARTAEVVKLQSSLMQHTQSGILSPSADGSKPEHSMPTSWVRAAMVIRCNATMRGHSAVSFPIIKAMADMLAKDITPVVPLRGSVSASGDLMPLAYVAGALEGNPDILVEGNGQVYASPEALSQAGLLPVELGPKEGLSLINGTSSSAGLGALVMARAHSLAVLTQVLAAGAVEGLGGSQESFHPFIAQTRPHPGQIECASNIFAFLHGSALARDVLAPKNRRREDLVQDRYSLRSGPQWIGPQLEDLLLADQQITIELNSSCDNPLVDSSTNDIYYGCNFQAASVTSAMEKIRLALQMFGRMLFAQSTEMIDAHLSGGLPANLAADDPSLSYTMKGVDVNMAAYMAELSYLANPMSSHVQAAEMHNQSVNSMALASARMSWDASDILLKMSACSAYVVCQALDLRALHSKFIADVTDVIVSTVVRDFANQVETHPGQALPSAIKAHIGSSWYSTGKLDLHVRCESLIESLVPVLVAHLDGSVAKIREWKAKAIRESWNLWQASFASFCTHPHTAQLLGRSSRVLYEFVRRDLGVPFHEGFIEHPTIKNNTHGQRAKKTIGGWISMIHEGIQDGSIYNKLIPLAEQILQGEHKGAKSKGQGLVNGFTNGSIPVTNGEVAFH